MIIDGTVWLVSVDSRFDGLYVFTDEEHADRFADAVRASGGECDIREEVLNGAEGTAALIAAELEESESALPVTHEVVDGRLARLEES